MYIYIYTYSVYGHYHCYGQMGKNMLITMDRGIRGTSHGVELGKYIMARRHSRHPLLYGTVGLDL